MTKNRNRVTISNQIQLSCPDSIQAQNLHFCYKINLGHTKKLIALEDEFWKLHDLISFNTSLLLSVWDIFQEGGCSLQYFCHSSSHFFTLHHLSCLSSVQPPYIPPLFPFSRTLLLIFRSITLHPRWPTRTVSHWLKEEGDVINHCRKVKENG